jgi:serine/threonine protein kinase
MEMKRRKFQMIIPKSFMHKIPKKYHIKSSLYLGEYSKVFKGRDSNDNKDIILKFVKKECKESLSKEIEILEKIKNLEKDFSMHFAKVFYYNETEDGIIMVTEFKGESLFNINF